MVGGRLVMPVGPLTPLNTSRSSKKSPLARRQCAPMSGLELLPKAIRARCPDHHDHAYGDAETKRRALESGADSATRTQSSFEQGQD
jgi:hypothetical protein